MIIKCILSVSLESIEHYTQQFSELPPLPEKITRKGPYVKKKEGASYQIVILYEFEGSKLREAWKNVLNQLDSLRGVPGFTLSAHIMKKDEQVKQPIDLVKAPTRA